MDLNPPAGSKISIAHDGPEPIIVIPQPPGGLMGHVFALILAVLFLFGAIPMTLNAASLLFSGNRSLLVVFWMCVSSYASVFMAHALHRVLYRRTVPETLTLSRDGVCYDSGFVPFLRQGRIISFPKNVHVDLDRHQLQSLRLRGNVVGQWRLTVDVGADRIDIAPNASGLEREWLARVLTNHYSLPNVRPSGGDDA